MFTYISSVDTEPPQSPGRLARLSPSTGMPSFHQLIFAGGLLELESQISLARMPGTRFLGATLILTVSGGTRGRETTIRHRSPSAALLQATYSALPGFWWQTEESLWLHSEPRTCRWHCCPMHSPAATAPTQSCCPSPWRRHSRACRSCTTADWEEDCRQLSCTAASVWSQR